MQLQKLTPLLFLALALPAVADDVLQQAAALLAQQKPAEALSLLAPLEDERAGNADYDYLLGQALLESGDPSNAVFPFERCLSVAPDDGPCRVQMARTHLAMGETANARAELETIQTHNPPPQVQDMVNRFLGVVSTREKQEKRLLTAFVQAGAGFDNNVNGGTSASQIAIPAFNNLIFTIPASSQALDSTFLNLQAGGAFQYRSTPKLTTFGDIGLNSRSYTDESNFSNYTLDGNLGAALRLATGMVSGKLSLQNMWLDGDNYRNLVGLGGQYQRDIGMTGQLAFFLQANQLSYDSQSNRDSTKTTLGAAWSQGFESRFSPVAFASLYGGSENMKESTPTATQFGSDFLGLRGGASLTLNNTWRLNGSLSYESRQYDTDFTGFKKPRDENQIDLNLGAAWKIRPALTLQPTYSYTRNNSNIALFDFDRHVISVDLRYDM
ncbi:MAG TPA: tetratricopeptide repeat protein [Fluviicoccus sp.]|nr:tetratricopeptide repeat protein [Fluviicoccus sp.]